MTMKWQTYTEEQMAEAFEILENHNKSVPPKKEGARKVTFILDVTGKHQAYFTLWREVEPDPKYPTCGFNTFDIRYVSNVSTDLIEAVRKVCDRFPNSSIEVDRTGNRTHLIGKNRSCDKFTFGKYRGELFEDVLEKDPQYFIFLDRNANPLYAHKPQNQAIAYFATAAGEMITKKNQETSTSEYVGVVGKKMVLDLELYKAKKYPGKKTTYCNFKDSKGNRFKGRILGQKFGDLEERVGETIRMKCQIDWHDEIMGIKFTGIKGTVPA